MCETWHHWDKPISHNQALIIFFVYWIKRKEGLWNQKEDSVGMVGKGGRAEKVQVEGVEVLRVYRVHAWEGSNEIHSFLLLIYTFKKSPADSWVQQSLRNADLMNILQRAKKKLDSILHFQKRKCLWH